MSLRSWLTRRTFLISLVGLGILSVAGYFWFHRTPAAGTARELAFSEFLLQLDRGNVTELAIAGQQMEGTLRDGRLVQTVSPSGYASSPAFMSELMGHKIRVTVRPASDAQPLVGFGTLITAALLLVVAGVAVVRLGSGKVPTLDGKAHTASQQDEVITFADVAGVDEAKEEVAEIVDFLRDPGRFTSLGGRMPKGVLLVGPPGTGKTLLARSIAGEAGVPFLFASGADFVEMYAGVGAARVRRLFKDAARHQSCIVFIDELDAVGRSRGSNSLSHEEREQTLNQLLVEMDGFAAHRGIVVIAATNRPDILDEALLRPGRFDRQVTVGVPDLKGRQEILRVHTRKVPLAEGTDLRSIARGTPGFSGADLANLVNEAALLAARAGRSEVSDRDLDAARDKVLMGVERRSLVMSDKERTNCAYHEAGHALVAALMPDADPLHKVTIIPRGRALGVTMQLPEGDRHTHTLTDLQTQVAVLMGGRAAEELLMGHFTSGASNDIERATEIARKMVCELGMSPLGPLALRRSSGGWDERPAAVLSEEMARRVDEEIRGIVMQAYDQARCLLTDNRSAAVALAEQLLAVESLDAAEINGLLASHGAVTGSGALRAQA